MKNYLEFEKEIKALEDEVGGLKSPFGSEGISEVDTNKIKSIQEEINIKLKETYANLNNWQKTLVARHEDRPRANFYINKIFSSFTALAGDRLFADDKSVTAGFGLIDNKSVLVIGQEVDASRDDVFQFGGDIGDRRRCFRPGAFFDGGEIVRRASAPQEGAFVSVDRDGVQFYGLMN